MAEIHSSQDQRRLQLLGNGLLGLQGEGSFPVTKRTCHVESGEWKDRARPAPFDRLIGRSKFLAERKLIIDDVDVPPREALRSGRLQHSTNHKRSLQESDLQIRQKLQRMLSNQEPETSPRKRYSSEDPTPERCVQRRRGSSQGDNGHPAINNAGAMTPGKSQGTRQPPTQRTPTPETPPLLSSNAKPKQDASIEILDSAEDAENEGTVVSAKRVKREKILKQHRSEVVFADPTELATAEVVSTSDSLLTVPRLKGQSVKQHRSEVVVADSTGLKEQGVEQTVIPIAEDKDFAYDNQIASKNKNHLWTNWLRKSSAIPDYGDLRQQHIPAPNIVRERSMAPYKNGGPRPVNTLAGHGKKIPAQKPFNLTRPTESETVPARKRQKIEGGSISSSDSTKPGVESEPNPTSRNSTQRQHNAESPQSPSQTARRGNGSTMYFNGKIEEYRAVLSATKGKQSRKPRRPSTSDGGKGKRYLVQPDDERPEMTRDCGELSDDPIQSESGSLANDSRPHGNGRSKIAVQIKPREYQGSNLKPARDKSAMSGGPNEPEISPHFVQTTVSKQQQQGNRNVNATVRTRQGEPSSLVEDGGVDDLAAEHYQDVRSKQVAKRLHIANKVLNSKVQSTSPSVVVPQRQPPKVFAVVQPSSDEDDSTKRGNIPQTNFTHVRKANTKRKIDHEVYKVKQLYTQSSRWLSRGEIGSTKVDFNKDTFTFYDGTDVEIPELAVAFKIIQRVVYNENCPKFVIHKPGSTHALKTHQIHVEILDISESGTLLRAIKNKYPAIHLKDMSSEHMDKVFETVQKPLKEQSGQVLREDPQDILLAKKRQQDRQEQKVESKKANGRRVVDRLQAREGDYLPESVTRSGKKRYRSNSEPSDDERRPKFKHPPVSASEFYSATDSRQSRATAYGTRSSARDKGPSAHNYQKLRSASPERWTAAHPGWEELWQTSIIYPREGKNKATVDKEDIERLDEGAFLNDNLIEFYLRWLEARVTDRNPEFAKRVYFCNTFFYVRLTQDAKGKRGINYDAVARWTAKVDLFSYDYIIVPVNESLHWYLAIICNVPRLLDPEKDLVSSSPSRGLVDNTKEKQEHADATAKSLQGDPVPFASWRQPAERPEEPIVNTKMESMSLEDAPVEALNDAATKGSLSSNVSRDSELEGWPESDPQALTEKKQHERRVSAAGFEEQKGSQAIHDVDPVVSDLQGSPARKAARGKKGHRKSLPTPRRYNLNEPRIITLDSFGNGHSPTCTNLRDYLVAEAKAKKNRDITPPNMIGMTAKRIPGQTNYCDCGLYLLSYVEMFLKKGDEFIHSLLQNSLDEDLEWRHGPEMRLHIRNLLFDIQKEQVAENERVRKEKGKAKRLVKAGSKSIPTELGSPTLQEHNPETPKHENGNSSNTSVEDVKTKTKSTAQAPLEGVKSSHEGQQSGIDNSETVVRPKNNTPLRPFGRLGGQKSIASAFGARHDPAESQQNSIAEPGSTNKEVVEILDLDSPTKSDRNVGQKIELSKSKALKDQDHILRRGAKDVKTQLGGISPSSPLPGARRDEHDTLLSSTTTSRSLGPKVRTHTLSVEPDDGTSSTLHRKSPLAGLSPSDPEGVIDLEEDSEQFVSAGETVPKGDSMTSRPMDDAEMLWDDDSQQSLRRSSPDSPVIQVGSPTTRSKASAGQKSSASRRSPVVEVPSMTKHTANKTSPPRPRSRFSKDGAALKISPSMSTRRATRTEEWISDTRPSGSKKRKPTEGGQDVQEFSWSKVHSDKPSFARDSSDKGIIGRHKGDITGNRTGKHTKFDG